MSTITKIVKGKLVEVKVRPKSKAGRKPLPLSSRRQMYSTRLHPTTIENLKKLKAVKRKPIARIIELLVTKEAEKLGL